MELQKTIISLQGIAKRMTNPPDKTDLYMFGKGLSTALNREQLLQVEQIVKNDYGLFMEAIRIAKSQSKTKKK